MARKVKNCYSCPAHTDGCCLLGYERTQENCNIIGPKGMGHVTICSPKECCHKPKTIKEFSLNVCGYFDNNQVCSGGVLLLELDCNLQSKTNEGLYFIGEVVDVDGVCGGYNLQWAWTSGKIVGENL